MQLETMLRDNIFTDQLLQALIFCRVHFFPTEVHDSEYEI